MKSVATLPTLAAGRTLRSCRSPRSRNRKRVNMARVLNVQFRCIRYGDSHNPVALGAQFSFSLLDSPQ
jgi:hypothetical protein